MAEQDDKQVQEPEELRDDLVRCPCCGRMTLQKPIKPGDDLLDHWLACTSTGVPFAHTYPLYGGKVLVTATCLDTDTGVRIESASAAVTRLIEDKTYAGLSETAMRTLVNAARLFSVVREIVFVGANDKRFDTGAVADQALSELDLVVAAVRAGKPAEEWGPHLETASKLLDDKANISALPSNVLIAVGRTHQQLSEILMSSGFDEDFWQGIELA